VRYHSSSTLVWLRSKKKSTRCSCRSRPTSEFVPTKLLRAKKVPEAFFGRLGRWECAGEVARGFVAVQVLFSPSLASERERGPEKEEARKGEVTDSLREDCKWEGTRRVRETAWCDVARLNSHEEPHHHSPG